MVAGMLTSCSKDDSDALIGNNNYPADGMVRISTTLDDAQPLSRAEGTTAAYTGTNLSLSVDYGATDNYTRANILWNNTSSAWSQDLTADANPMLWKNATAAAKIYAFAPHVAGATDLTAVPFSVKADQSAAGAILASDLVGYKDEAFVPGSSLDKLNELNLAFTHRLSKLTVNLTYGNQYPEGARPGIEKLEVINTSLSATYNAQTLTATASATTGEIKAATVKADSYEAILVPQTVAASTKLVRVTLSDGTKLAYTIPAAQLFEANKHYTLSLRVGKDKLEVGSVTVDGWGDGTPIPGGEALLLPLDVTALTADDLTDALIGSYVQGGRLVLKGDFDSDAKFGKIATYIRNKTAPVVTDFDFSATTGMTELYWGMDGSSLVKVNLPVTVTGIFRVFEDCTSLTTVTGGGVVKDAGNAFLNCTALKTVTVKLKKLLTTFDNAGIETYESEVTTEILQCSFQDCLSLTSVSCPNAGSLGNDLFLRCKSLTEIRLTAEAFVYVSSGSYSSTGEHFDPFTGILNRDKATLYLNANQAKNIKVASGECTWTPVDEYTGENISGLEVPVILTGFKAVICGDQQVYPLVP